MTHDFFMQKALAQARIAYEEGEIPVGAVITAQGRIIAQAYNQTERLNDVTAHAEILAITAATQALGGKYLQNCTLYVTLAPCLMCAGALFWAQPHSIVYGAEDDKRGFTLYQNLSRQDGRVLHPKTQVISGILENDCRELLTKFFQKLRN